MGLYKPPPNETTERLFRKHVAEMRKYASELQAVLGSDSPIVKRIYSCAAQCDNVLNRVAASAGEAGTATTPKSGVVHEHATGAAGDAQKEDK